MHSVTTDVAKGECQHGTMRINSKCRAAQIGSGTVPACAETEPRSFYVLFYLKLSLCTPPPPFSLFPVSYTHLTLPTRR